MARPRATPAPGRRPATRPRGSLFPRLPDLLLSVALLLTFPAAAQDAAQDTPSTPADDPFAAARLAMVRDTIEARGVTDEAVLRAMRTVPRHAFVPPEYQDEAYADHPLPIGFGQTISQPYIVALMTQAAAVEPGDRVLEVGTGSGYQAAVLAALGAEVHSIEIIGPLADRAEATLQQLGYDVHVYRGDGYFGLPEHAPFDAIVVTAAPDHIPQPLVEQLAVGGRMVIPVGPVGGYQTLWLAIKESPTDVVLENLGAVRFVPLTREPR